MNIEKLEQVEAWLLAGAPERTFNMECYINGEKNKDNWCGTSCCIAGYVYQTVVDNTGYEVSPVEVSRVAQRELGLDKKQARLLFHPANCGDWALISPAQAAKAVRNLIETGMPQWENILDFE